MKNETVEQIRVEDIIPNRFQPRLTFNERELQELADSIKKHGVIQPLVLRKLGNKFEIIAGERRYKASCIAGLKTVPAIVRELSDNESAEIALIENLQRKNLNSIEEALSFKNLLNRGYTTQDKLAETLGVTETTISNKLKLLNLCEEVQSALLNNKISERHARSLLNLSNPNEQKVMLERVLSERLTVKQLDNELMKLKGTNQNTDFNIEPQLEPQETKPKEIQSNINIEPIEQPTVIPDEIPKKELEGENIMKEENKTNLFGFQVNNDTNTTQDIEPSNGDNNVTDSNPNPVDNNISNQPAPQTNNGNEQIGFNPFSNNNKFFSYNENNLESPNSNTENESSSDNTNVQEPVDTTSNEEQVNQIEDEPSEKFEMFDIFGDKLKSITNNETPLADESKKITMGDQINKIRDAVRDIENTGFRIEMEEYDLEDIYQINIKIRKKKEEKDS